MERWDLLDDDRRLTGETLRRGEPLPPGRFHTIIGVWTIHDRLRRILLTKRHPQKLICPNQWGKHRRIHSRRRRKLRRRCPRGARRNRHGLPL